MKVLTRKAVARARSRDGAAAAERLQGALMAGALLFGAWQGFAALSTPAAGRRLGALLDGPALLDGRAAAAVEALEAHALPADALLRAAGGVVRWRVFRSGGPQVAVGCGDWLYLTEELRPWPGAEAAMRARADVLARAAGLLAARGIPFAAAVVPDKARVEAANLCGAPRSAQAEARYGAFAKLLEARRVPAVDLAAPMRAARAGGPLYLRTDTHWNGRGAALAADAVAAALPRLEPTAAYRTVADAGETERPGDLLRLMSLDAVPDVRPALRPRPDRVRIEHTEAVERPAPATDLLGGAPGGEAVLLGSSFSLNGNFAGRLEEALGRPVDDLAEAGGGFAGSAARFFGGGALDADPPSLVVWEIPERAVGQPLSDADRALIAALSKYP